MAGLSAAAILLSLVAVGAGGGGEDDSRYAVCGMACLYNEADLSVFVRSLRATGYTGAVHLAVEPELDANTSAFLRAHGVDAHPEPCRDIIEQKRAFEKERAARKAALRARGRSFSVIATVRWLARVLGGGGRAPGRPDGPAREPSAEDPLDRPRWHGSLAQMRHDAYTDWISRGSYTHAWLVDVRDVLFVAHPFAEPARPADAAQSAAVLARRRAGGSAAPLSQYDLALFAESRDLTGWELERLGACFSNKTARVMSEAFHPNVCSGTLYGTRRALLKLASDMLSEAAEAARSWLDMCHENDQPLLNHLLWRRRLGGVGTHASRAYGQLRIFDLTEGPVRTLKGRSPNCLGEVGAFTRLRRRAEAGLASPAPRAPLAPDPLTELSIVHKWDHCTKLSRAACASMVGSTRGPPACWLPQLMKERMAAEAAKREAKREATRGGTQPSGARARASSSELASPSSRSSY